MKNENRRLGLTSWSVSSGYDRTSWDRCSFEWSCENTILSSIAVFFLISMLQLVQQWTQRVLLLRDCSFIWGEKDREAREECFEWMWEAEKEVSVKFAVLHVLPFPFWTSSTHLTRIGDTQEVLLHLSCHHPVETSIRRETIIPTWRTRILFGWRNYDSVILIWLELRFCHTASLLAVSFIFFFHFLAHHHRQETRGFDFCSSCPSALSCNHCCCHSAV